MDVNPFLTIIICRLEIHGHLLGFKAAHFWLVGQVKTSELLVCTFHSAYAILDVDNIFMLVVICSWLSLGRSRLDLRPL